MRLYTACVISDGDRELDVERNDLKQALKGCILVAFGNAKLQKSTKLRKLYMSTCLQNKNKKSRPGRCTNGTKNVQQYCRCRTPACGAIVHRVALGVCRAIDWLVGAEYVLTESARLQADLSLPLGPSSRLSGVFLLLGSGVVLKLDTLFSAFFA
ncbi:hypothetical protein NDU88_002406 [Pleurodeles waltl]|uniref:Uncharacterized protein n=1 Tax=Pleurodeles waltl TaxID=8319 RepID=A0AAV7NHW4_PLEWA|nr:hypothetical protein NDU88_002406 [Pleurodeles waltl]